MSARHIDHETLRVLQDVLEDEYPNLLEAYLSDSTARLDQLRLALRNNDAEALWQTAHSFKGSSSNVGVPLLTELCLQLETAARACQMNHAGELLEQAEREFELVHSLIRAELQLFGA